VRVKTRSS